MRIQTTLAMCGLLAAVGIGCGAGTAESNRPVVERLQDDNPSVRVRAIIEAGEQKNRRAVPLLIDRLDDDDSDIRLFSIRALHKITGEDFDYVYYAPPAQRREAIDRWRRWLAAEWRGPDGAR